MKRSEALALIANQLDFLRGDFEGFRPFDDLGIVEKSNADVILTTLEQAGMLPPPIEKSHHTDLYEAIIKVNEWEPE